MGPRSAAGSGAREISYRRLVKVGNSVYVSVPRGWIESRGLGPGSLVAVEAVEGGLLLKPLSGPPGEPKAKRLVGGRSRDVIAAYLAGYEVIEVEKPAQELREALERLLNLLVGVEVVEDRSDRVVLHCFVGESYDLRSVLARMDSLSRSMYVDAAAALERGDLEALESVRRRDDKLDRLYFLSVRLIRSAVQSAGISAQERLFLVDARLFAKLLEEIGDEAERMTHLRPAEGLAEAARVVESFQREAVKAFLSGGAACPLPGEAAVTPHLRSSEGAFSALERIYRLVLDLTELASH